jgi:hypothetical protein
MSSLGRKVSHCYVAQGLPPQDATRMPCIEPLRTERGLFTLVLRETVRKGSEELAVYPYKAPQRSFSTQFGLLTPPKSTLRVLLVPLFGQSQKVNSPRLAAFMDSLGSWLLSKVHRGFIAAHYGSGGVGLPSEQLLLLSRVARWFLRDPSLPVVSIPLGVWKRNSANVAMKLSKKGFEQASKRGFGRCSVPKSAQPDPREAPVRAPPGLFRQFLDARL